MDWTPERDLPLRFHIDANRINARGALVHMNRLERWNASEVIDVLLTEPAFEEVATNAARTRKGIDYIQTLTTTQTPDEAEMLVRIEHAAFPNGARTPSERTDVAILFHAQKYCAILVTADGNSGRQPRGILGAAASLATLGITVLTDEQACALVERKVRERDEDAVRWAESTGQAVPDWVGTDG